MSRSGAAKAALDDRSRLDLFCERAEQLRQSRVVQAGFGVEHPSKEELESFLLVFRPFASDKEPICMARIYDLCDLQLTDDSLRTRMRESRAEWNRASKSSGLAFIHFGRPVTPGHVANLLLNGRYFHVDPDKRQALEDLSAPGPGVMQFQFLSYLARCARQILFTDTVVREAFTNRAFAFL